MPLNPDTGQYLPHKSIPGGMQTTGGGLLNNHIRTPPPVSTGPSTTASTQKNLQSNFNPLMPPTLKTLVYSPDVQILIVHEGIQYDVSADLVRGSIVRKENSASSLFFTVANKGLRYNARFGRMDRVIVNMKRIEWVQVFSGYLDTIPWQQMYPGTVDFKATCTLKRLLYTWWDPALPQSRALFEQRSYRQAQQSESPHSGPLGDEAALDSGLGPMLRQLLIQVGGWLPQNIWIQNFPSKFFSFLTSHIQGTQDSNTASVKRFKHLLLGDDISEGVGRFAGMNQSVGQPGPYVGVTTPVGAVGAYELGRPFYIQEIVGACDEMGLGPNTSDIMRAEGYQKAARFGTKNAEPLDPGARADQKAWQSVQSTASSYQKRLRNDDAAVLALMTTEVESSTRMLANRAVPASLNFPYDGFSDDHKSIGLFQQQPNWGSARQLMNARCSAELFFGALQKLNWRNMPPGQACQEVQRSAFPYRYAAHQKTAEKLVQSYRKTAEAGKAVATQAASTIDANLPSVGGLNPLDVNAQKFPHLTTGNATPYPADPAATSSMMGKPQPDSEGAINCGKVTALGRPYVYGTNGPDTFDCSGLMQWMFRGVGLAIGRDTYTQAATLSHIPASNIERGDIIQPVSHHTYMWLGDGTIFEAATSGVPVHIVTNHKPLTQCYAILHACDNGGVDPAAPWNYPGTSSPGKPPAATSMITEAGTGTGGSDNAQEPIARNLFTFMFDPTMFATSIAEQFYGEKAYINDQPLIQMVSAVASSGLRNFASAPNGDFVAYYPDYFGLDGKPPIFKLEDIELKDVRIDLSDDPMTTHVYVCGDYTQMGQGFDPVMGWLDTAGVATVENEWLYARMKAVAPGDSPDTMVSGQQLMYRFGVRPLTQSYTMAGSHSLEFMIASKIFMQKWAEQYQTNISISFMPELQPGSRIVLGSHNLQVYVSEVTHRFDFNSGFSTDLVIMAPSNPNAIAIANAQTSHLRPTVPHGVIEESNNYGFNIGSAVPDPGAYSA